MRNSFVAVAVIPCKRALNLRVIPSSAEKSCHKQMATSCLYVTYLTQWWILVIWAKLLEDTNSLIFAFTMHKAWKRISVHEAVINSYSPVLNEDIILSMLAISSSFPDITS